MPYSIVKHSLGVFIARLIDVERSNTDVGGMNQQTCSLGGVKMGKMNVPVVKISITFGHCCLFSFFSLLVETCKGDCSE